MARSNRCYSTVAAYIVGGLLSIGAAAEKGNVPTALEGYVRDDQGKGVEGVLVMVSEGSYTTLGMPVEQAMVRARTGIDIDTSDVAVNHDVNTHFTKTDRNGHYAFTTLTRGRYRFAVSGKKKRGGDMTTHTDNLVPNKTVYGKYQFPPMEIIQINATQPTIKSLTLRAISVEECRIPAPRRGLPISRSAAILGQGAVRGTKEGMRALAYAYEQGQNGVEANAAQAICWFRKAAAEGDAPSIRELRKLGNPWLPSK